MTVTDQIAQAALALDNLQLRSVIAATLREKPQVSSWPAPASERLEDRAIAASIVELIARRNNQHAPSWTADIPSLTTPFYLVKAAATMKGVRRICDEQSPVELRKRQLLAPPEFLSFA